MWEQISNKKEMIRLIQKDIDLEKLIIIHMEQL